jgi:hypothetical protein
VSPAKLPPRLSAAVARADALVYPALTECDIGAQREQNRTRWFQVLAILGALLTTVFGALEAWQHGVWWPGVVVATLGASTSALTTIARRQGSQDAYLQLRLRAERLRSLYFKHVAEALTAPAADESEDELSRALQHEVAKIRFGSLGSGGGQRR